MRTATEFPLHRLTDIQNAPENFRLLERMATPMTGPISPAVGDEEPIVFLDCETTGIDEEDCVIELGLVRAEYSPSEQRLTAVVGVASLYNDPGRPIPEFITHLTGYHR